MPKRPIRRSSHLDEKGEARMVDVGAKPVTRREAVAQARVEMRPSTLQAILRGGAPKGDVFGAARIAGIMAAKRTPEFIPLCHPLPIESVRVDFTPKRGGVLIESRVAVAGKTGVEMEALTAAAVAALTIYDMCKGLDRALVISDLHLVRKSGGSPRGEAGASGDFTRPSRREQP
jgi:cyclic pyranopterin phosphate synthase